MQKFGIEIRRAGNYKNLYADVDNILSKTSSMSGAVGDAVKVQTVAHSLNKMLKTENHFSVCTVRDCAKLCQILIPVEREAVYSSIHCMGWDEMLSEYRQMVVAMVLDDFRSVLNNNREETK